MDVESLCRRIYKRSGLEFSYHDEEDALSFLIECCWELSLDYRQGVIRKGFGAYATIGLRFKLIDWQRKRFGRTVQQWSAGAQHHGGKAGRIERPRPVFASLDELPERSGLLDDHRDRLSSLLGLDRPGDRNPLRGERALGEPPDRVAA